MAYRRRSKRRSFRNKKHSRRMHHMRRGAPRIGFRM